MTDTIRKAQLVSAIATAWFEQMSKGLLTQTSRGGKMPSVEMSFVKQDDADEAHDHLIALALAVQERPLPSGYRVRAALSAPSGYDEGIEAAGKVAARYGGQDGQAIARNIRSLLGTKPPAGERGSIVATLGRNDLQRLSRAFNVAGDLRVTQDYRINEWLKAQIAAAPDRGEHLSAPAEGGER